VLVGTRLYLRDRASLMAVELGWAPDPTTEPCLFAAAQPASRYGRSADAFRHPSGI